MPKDLEPPRVNLSLGIKDHAQEPRAALPSSPLGVWYLDGCETFLETVETVLAYSPDEAPREDDDFYRRIGRLVKIGVVPGNFTQARGRSNLNLKAVPPIDGAELDSPTTKTKAPFDEIKVVHKLQEQASSIATLVSGRMEVWLGLAKGSMGKAHEHGKSSTLRLLDYPAGVSVPPHTDGSAYTIVYNNCSMIIQSPDDDSLWYELPANKDLGQLLLILGSHLDQAIPKRLEQMGLGHTDSDKLRAPVHRLNASGIPRRALTLHIKADTVWPSALEELNQSNHKAESEGVLTADDYHERDIAWDAELFSQYLCRKCVPSVENVQYHLTLLASIVEGHDARKFKDDATTCSISGSDSSSFSSVDADPQPTQNGKSPAYHLPSVYCTGYWQLQTQRYRTFLRIHQHCPSEAAGMLPPREIHHVWLCHQLHPLRYKADCEQLLGMILGHDNCNFCLRGCPTFHKLWEAETGACWPSQADMRQEADIAEDLPEIITNQDDLNMISANLWHNYDSLSRLYFELQDEAPDLFALDSDRATSFLNEARLEYARFLIAASYAATVGMMVTPSGPIDLVWHTHQTDPKAYDGTIRREFSTGPIDHIPCGALASPSPEDGKEWLEMTDKIWIHLYGKGVNVQGQAIHCCTPQNSRPERAVLENSELAWWFPTPGDNGSCVKNFDGFPSTREELTPEQFIFLQRVEVMDNQTSLDTLSVMRNVFQPVLEAMKSNLLTHKEDVKEIKGSNEYRFRKCLWISSRAFPFFMFCVPLLLNSIIPADAGDAGDFAFFATMTLSFWGGTFLFHRSFNIEYKNQKLLWPCKEKFWSQIRALMVSFNSQAAEHNIGIEFRQTMAGPIDPSHTENDRYNGPAIVFRALGGVEGRDNIMQAGMEEGAAQQGEVVQMIVPIYSPVIVEEFEQLHGENDSLRQEIEELKGEMPGRMTH